MPGWSGVSCGLEIPGSESTALLLTGRESSRQLSLKLCSGVVGQATRSLSASCTTAESATGWPGSIAVRLGSAGAAEVPVTLGAASPQKLVVRSRKACLLFIPLASVTTSARR